HFDAGACSQRMACCDDAKLRRDHRAPDNWTRSGGRCGLGGTVRLREYELREKKRRQRNSQKSPIVHGRSSCKCASCLLRIPLYRRTGLRFLMLNLQNPDLDGSSLDVLYPCAVEPYQETRL